jgi:hypothetical protein
VQRVPEHDLHLGVDAAELVSGPPLHGRVDGGVQPQQDGLALRARPPLLWFLGDLGHRYQV